MSLGVGEKVSRNLHTVGAREVGSRVAVEELLIRCRAADQLDGLQLLRGVGALVGRRWRLQVARRVAWNIVTCWAPLEKNPGRPCLRGPC